MKNTISLSAIIIFCSYLISSIYLVTYSAAVNATVVEVRTNVGNFQVNIFDNDTPRTAENFLSYVNAGAYANNTVHRSAPNFVIQMGGFQYNNSFPPNAIATGTAVINEPVLSNVRGTIAMAKLGGNANSATSQFYVNVLNNASNLDNNNGGFTVFGQVLDNGMEVVDQIAALPSYNFGGAFAELPLSNYTSTDANNNVEPNENNLVIITDIVVVDDKTITNPQLSPVKNTLINTGGGVLPSSGGGSFGISMLIGLILVSAHKYLRRMN